MSFLYPVVVEDKPRRDGFTYAIVTGDEDGKSNQFLWRSFQSATEAKNWLLETIKDYTGQDLRSEGPYSFSASFLIPTNSFITYIPVAQARQQIYVSHE